ncbi:MAG: host cell division inhibitor Icd-like protein [Providencia heimbachae]|nr:host cell division inhibitor Icd-like protein [Providencia heimbachae]
MPTIHYLSNNDLSKVDIHTGAITFIYRFWSTLNGKQVRISTCAKTEQEARSHLGSNLLFCARIRQGA